jgi:hypothetical protein
MFRGLINDAKLAVGNLVLKYVARASVAVPFVIAVAFAVAAIAAMLVERFGAVTGCWIMAGGMAAIGIIAAIVVSAREHKEEVAEELKEQGDDQRCHSSGFDTNSRGLTRTSNCNAGRCSNGIERGSRARAQLAARTVAGPGRRTVLAGANCRGGVRSRGIGRPPQTQRGGRPHAQPNETLAKTQNDELTAAR